MGNRTTYRRVILLGGFAVLSTLATIVLDAPRLQFQSLEVWSQLTVPILLLTGFIGSAINKPLLRLMGWIGIGTFILFGLNFVIAGESYVLGGPKDPMMSAPRLPSATEFRVRFVVWLILSLSLAWSYRKLATKRG